MTRTDGAPLGRRALLSTMWIFAVLNYLYCDVLGLMDPNLLQQYLGGAVGGVVVTQGFLLGAGVLMEISMAMVLLSRVLQYRPNRWANVIAGVITTLVQIGSMFFGASPTLYYIFFSVVEIATTAAIVYLAWTWRSPEAG
jgi:hypothetical protein